MSDRIIKSRYVNPAPPSPNMSSEFVKADFEPEGTGNGGNISGVEADKDKVEKRMEIEREMAHREGLLEGKKEGIEIEKRRLSSTLTAFTNLIKELSESKKRILKESEEETLDLAISIAEKVIHQEVSTEKGVILSVLRAAIKNILDKDEIKIRLNPRDYACMMEVKPEILRGFDGIRNMAFEEDEAIEQGGAVIETLLGEVDARLDHQLSEIKEGLREAEGKTG